MTLRNDWTTCFSVNLFEADHHTLRYIIGTRGRRDVVKWIKKLIEKAADLELTAKTYQNLI